MSVVAVIGLGYVGLPLVIEFGKHGRTIGFDISVPKVESCLRGVDPSRELTDEEMQASTHAVYTADPAKLSEADFIVVAVPTPVDTAHIPDFRPLIGSANSIRPPSVQLTSELICVGFSLARSVRNRFRNSPRSRSTSSSLVNGCTLMNRCAIVGSFLRRRKSAQAGRGFEQSWHAARPQPAP